MAAQVEAKKLPHRVFPRGIGRERYARVAAGVRHELPAALQRVADPLLGEPQNVIHHAAVAITAKTHYPDPGTRIETQVNGHGVRHSRKSRFDWWKGTDSNPRPRHYEIGPRLKVICRFNNLPRGARCTLARRSTT